MGMFSPWHLLIIGVVALLLFGNRLPEVARSMGRAINEFKRGLKDLPDDGENPTSGSGPDTDNRLKSGPARRALDEPDAEPRSQQRVKETQPEEHESVK